MAQRLVGSIGTFALCLALAAGCDDDPGQPPADAGDGGRDAPAADTGATDAGAEATAGDAAAGDAAAGDAAAEGGGPLCQVGASSCPSKTQQTICKLGANGKAGWVTEPCAAGTLCLDRACSAECADECNLGATRTVGGVTETCKPYAVAQDQAVVLGPGLHDRARQYNAWLRKHHLPGGTVGDAYFTDATHTTIAAYHGTGDSAIWTGSYLAGEALRLLVTGSKDAQANVEQLVEAIHRLFSVTGQTGYHARFTAPLNDPDPAVKALYEPTSSQHHVNKLNGVDYFWNGNTSRDQNSGVVMGYALAYEALSSASHKQMIRADMVDFCNELMKERKNLPLTIRFYAAGAWQELPVNITTRYTVLNATEYKNGKPWVQIGSSSNPSDLTGGQMYGFREYWPDYSTVLKQIPLLGGLITFPIPRADSTIMLGAIFRTCIKVTENVSTHATEHAAFKQFYAANIQSWLTSMKLYTFFNAGSPNCWDKYYGLNIAHEPAYNLVRMETDATLRAAFQKDVLEARLHTPTKDHKNVFFSFIQTAFAPAGSATQAIVTAAKAQLDQFPPPPHAHAAVDNTGKSQYPPHPQCSGLSTVATDVKDRVASDFIWQRQPFTLTTTGDTKKVYPGVDFMLPYWLGRHHGFYKDDAAGTCLRWLP